MLLNTQANTAILLTVHKPSRCLFYKIFADNKSRDFGRKMCIEYSVATHVDNFIFPAYMFPRYLKFIKRFYFRKGNQQQKLSNKKQIKIHI
jgi:hypothetical protein